MRRELCEKCVVSYILVVSFVFLPAIGYSNWEIDNPLPHVAYMFCHANVWHLAGNLFVLWILRGRLHLIAAMMIAYLFSLLPSWSIWGEVGVTMGFSGVLFAICGIKWGIYCYYASSMGRIFGRTALHEFMIKALPFALIGIVIPHLNWCIHLYCMLAGFVYGRCRR